MEPQKTPLPRASIASAFTWDDPPDTDELRQSPRSPSSSLLDTATSVTPATSAASRLSKDEKIRVMEWCLEHKKEYEGPKHKFWEHATGFILAQLNKSVLNPNRMVRDWVKKRRKEQNAEFILSGREIDNGEFNQRLDLWILFLDDVEVRKAQESAEKVAVAEDQRAMAKKAQEAMISRMSARKSSERSRSSDHKRRRSSPRTEEDDHNSTTYESELDSLSVRSKKRQATGRNHAMSESMSLFTSAITGMSAAMNDISASIGKVAENIAAPALGDAAMRGVVNEELEVIRQEVAANSEELAAMRREVAANNGAMKASFAENRITVTASLEAIQKILEEMRKAAKA